MDRDRDALETMVKERILRDGPISFADFMEMALYDTQLGYYSAPRSGQDYFTSPSTHPVFGALLAVQLEEVWASLGRPLSFPVIEVGAGSGLLGEDIKDYASRLSPGFAASMTYIPVERCHGDLPALPIEGCFLSNELLDAFPTHIVVAVDGRLKEVMVGVEAGNLVEVLGQPLSGVAEQLAEELATSGSPATAAILPEGYRTEVNLEVPRWITRVAGLLRRGVIISIDYGYLASELYSSERKRGTLLSYYQHTYNEELLRRVGRQDITSHADFSAAIRAGKRAGLRFEGLLTQREFLINLGIQDFMQALQCMGLPPLEYQANVYAVQELVRPDGMGSFRVLVQSRGLDGSKLRGVYGGGSRVGGVHELPKEVPLLRRQHLPLYQAKYSAPGEEFDVW